MRSMKNISTRAVACSKRFHYGTCVQRRTSLSIYPNPSNGKFKLSINAQEDGKVSIMIVNAAGAIIQSLSESKNGLFEKEIELSNLPAGVYYVKASLNKFSSSKALVIH